MIELAESPGKVHFRRPNFAIVVGGILVTLMVGLALFGPVLAPKSPFESSWIARNYRGEWIVRPYPSFTVPGYPLGTNMGGQDVLSRLMWAFRPTLVLAVCVAVTRLVVGSLVGFLEGWYAGRRLGDILSAATEMAASVPLLLIAILILYLIGMDRGVLPFIVALSLTGWTSTAQFMAERVRLLRHEPYIEAARALGAGDVRILIQHVLPQVANLLPVMLSFEMGATLIVVAELGFLNFFLAGGMLVNVGVGDAVELAPGLPELAQMLSDAWKMVLHLPWMAFWSGTAFFVAIFSFMMLGEGLKQQVLERMGVAVPGWNLSRAMGLSGGAGRDSASTSRLLPGKTLTG